MSNYPDSPWVTFDWGYLDDEGVECVGFGVCQEGTSGNILLGDDSGFVCETGSTERGMATARRIANCCNSHNELVKWLDAFLEITANPAPNAGDRKIQWLSVATNARLALEKARGAA